MNLLNLTLAYLRRRPLDALLDVVLLAVGTATIVVLILAGHQLGATLERDAEGIDLVVGAKGSPLQVILSSVFHIDVPTGNIPLAEAETLMRHPGVGMAIPLALGDSYRGYRVVGTTHDYATHHGAEPAVGSLWTGPFEVTLGARIAAEQGLEVGDEIVSAHGLGDAGDEHGERPLRVVGVLAPTGRVVDRLVLTSVETIWAVHGLDGGADSEITALLIGYSSPLAAAMLPPWINDQTSLQAAAPALETARLFTLFGVGVTAMRVFGGVLIGAAALGLFVSLYTAMRARRRDLAVMRTLGASRRTLVRHVVTEALVLVAAGTALGIAAGHGATEAIGTWARQARQFDVTGWIWLPGEWTLIVVVVTIGLVAAAIPAIAAYRTDIARTLARR